MILKDKCERWAAAGAVRDFNARECRPDCVACEELMRQPQLATQEGVEMADEVRAAVLAWRERVEP